MLKFKTIFFIFCLLIFLFQAGAVLALEIKYPSVPGAETPNQIQKKLDTGLINQKDALPLYINYFLRFFFVLSISIAVVVIIYGGVLYLISGAKPAVLITARAWMSRGLLGLTILICSYLVLGLINPQLLTFKIDREVSPIISFAPAEHPDDSIVALQIPAGTIIDEAISYMMAETSTEWGDVYAAEVPFLEIMDMLDNVTSTNQVLKVLFAECQCGKSKYHPEWDGFIGKCVAGDEGQATTSPEWWKLGSNVCSLVCEICGGENEPEDCDLREPDPDNPEQGLIKQARVDLIELFAKLQTQKVKLSSDQISLIEHVLKLNQTNFLLHKLLGTTFQNDFEALKKEIEAEGYPVSFEKPENLPEPGMIRMSPLRQDPFTFFAVTYDPFGIFGSIARLNKETEEESYRLSLFSILSQLSLEDIEDMINQCFVSAFGAGSFMLDNEQFLETVNEALQNSVSDYLGTLTLGAAFDIIDNFCEKLGDEIDDAVEDDANESIQDCINNCANQECIDKCQDTIPPHFLSKALNDLLVLDTKKHLPDGVEALLNEKLRQFIFDEELNHVLDDDILNLLDGVLQGALKKSIKDQIPFLREILEKKMLTVLPSFIVVPLRIIDGFLNKHLKNLKKTIDNQIQYVVNTLTGALFDMVNDLFADFQLGHPDLYREGLPYLECITIGGGDFNKGYYFYDEDHANDGDESEKCLKASASDINEEETFFNNSFHTFPLAFWEYCSGWADDCYESYCRDAGYCWYEGRGDEGQAQCQECDWIQFGDLSFGSIGKALLQGLFTFFEQFMFALIETSAYTLTQYARVWVEDEIIAPIQPYLDQLSSFQKKLHKFLQSTIADLLPQQIVQYLSSNIDQIMKKICEGKPIELYDGWDPITITPGMKEDACHIYSEFHQSILDNLEEASPLGAEIVSALNNKFQDFLSPWANEMLEKSFAQILFPEIIDITDIITGTPKKILCGQLLSDYCPLTFNTTGEPVLAKCNDIESDQDDFPFLPHIDYENAIWKEFSPEKKKAYNIGCSFVWYACENPLSNLNKGVGAVAKQILEQECIEVNSHIENICNGQGCDDCDIDALVLNEIIDEDTGKELKNKCTACDILVDNSNAYTLFKYAIEESGYGEIQDPDIRSDDQKEEEIEVFQWLTATFTNEDIRTDIDGTNGLSGLVEDRALTTMWNAGPPPSPRQEALSAQSPAQFEDLALAGIAWFVNNNSVYVILTNCQFGIMKYLKGEKYSGKNFLERTPYQLLYKDLCVKIKNDFKTDFPFWTIEKIMARLQAGTGGPVYSPEWLDKPTTADGLKILYNVKESDGVPENRKIDYVACLYLGYTLETILGIDQNLVTYVQPDGLQILFHLINEKLDHEEDMPVVLKNLLEDYLWQKPSDVLNELGKQAYNSGDLETGAFLQSMADDLKTPIHEYIKEEEVMTKKIIITIFEELFPACEEDLHHQDCPFYDTIGWEKWQDIQEPLALTPIGLISKYIVFPLIPEDITSARSIIDRIADPDDVANSGDETILGEPYVDTLGSALGLTRPLKTFSETLGTLSQSVDDLVLDTQKVVQKSFHTAFLDAPKAGFDWIVKTLGNLIGINLGAETAEQMVGVCRTVESEDNCREDEVYKLESSQCCTIAAGLVCINKCRQKPDEGCEADEGEVEGNDECCFPNCRKCRLATQRESEESDCLRFPDDPEKEYFIDNFLVDADTLDTLDLCCWDRELKQGEDGEPDKCCVNVMDCIIDKFTFHLELLSELFTEGPPLNPESINP